ncbi:penicillin-binding protein 2 [uncultured Cardiobacterium sp.]|uniref:peptidoglycan D,D-transpeptidase FtsI family protein n=1 Tax=uncultured Cardiobacterium sp. TaxID=417619 RepID=UPI0026108330|nr:penicillin-binding protein 2 [uncultured Cardiobacterium sp.]
MARSTSRYGATTRRNIVIAALVCMTLLLIGQLVRLQVTTARELTARGYDRSLRIQTEDALRGFIFDREGEPLAISTPVSTLIADPTRLWATLNGDFERLREACLSDRNYSEDCAWVNSGDEEETRLRYHYEILRPLAGLLDEDLARFYDELAKRGDSQFMYLGRQIPPGIAKEALDLKIPALRSENGYKRFYPSGEIMGQIIGYTDVEDKGQEGLEKLYENTLAGRPGKVKILQDRAGRALRVVEEVAPAAKGAQLQLSIDKRIQFITHQVLQDTMNQYRAESVTAVVIDIKSGEILAMVSLPAGNPNVSAERRAELLKNRAVTDTFEPGSTIKPLAVAAAIELGAISPSTRFKKGIAYQMGKNTVRDTHNYGTQDTVGIIRKSSNVGMALISERTPRKKYRAFMRKLGFGEPSGINFPGEQRGHFPRVEKLNSFEYATTFYGYGVSTSALQLAHAYATIANDGVAMPLSLLKVQTPPEGKRVMSAQTASAVRKMLEAVVGDGGTGRRANTATYTVAGKTGTSHKVRAGGGYAEKNYRGIFAGYAPAHEPRIAMVVVVDDPKGDYYGGLVAAPPFARIAEASLKMLNVLPDKISKTGEIALTGDNGEPFEDNDTAGAPDVPAKEITQ